MSHFCLRKIPVLHLPFGSCHGSLLKKKTTHWSAGSFLYVSAFIRWFVLAIYGYMWACRGRDIKLIHVWWTVDFRWTVIYKGNFACKYLYAQFYKSDFFFFWEHTIFSFVSECSLSVGSDARCSINETPGEHSVKISLRWAQTHRYACDYFSVVWCLLHNNVIEVTAVDHCA